MIPLRWSVGDRADTGRGIGRITAIVRYTDGEDWASLALESGGYIAMQLRRLELVPLPPETSGTGNPEDTTTPARGPEEAGT